MLCDTLKCDNSLGIFLSETWLSSDILDAEVKLDGYSLFRGDRIGRSRGGAALFLKDSINGRLAKSYSNGVVDFVVASTKVLDAIFVAIYRPPDTSVMEWKMAVDALIEEIDLIQAHGAYQRVLIGGDINFKNLQWNSDREMLIHSDHGSQQETLFTVCNRFLLTNLVNKPTRGENLLDVILYNDRDLYLKCESFLNIKYSDHNLIKVMLTVNT